MVITISFCGYGSETFGIGQRFGIVPIKDNCYGWSANSNENYMQDNSPQAPKEKLLRFFGKWHDPIPDHIEKTDVIPKNSIVDRAPTKGWIKGTRPLLFGLEKKFISDDELFFDEKHFYAIDKEKKKATFRTRIQTKQCKN